MRLGAKVRKRSTIRELSALLIMILLGTTMRNCWSVVNAESWQTRSTRTRSCALGHKMQKKEPSASGVIAMVNCSAIFLASGNTSTVNRPYRCQKKFKIIWTVGLSLTSEIFSYCKLTTFKNVSIGRTWKKLKRLLLNGREDEGKIM